MELFKTTKMILTWLLIYPIDKNVEIVWKYLNLVFGLFLLGVEVIGSISSAFYIFQNKNDLAEILYATFTAISLCFASIMFLTGVVTAHRFVNIIERIQGIYDISKKWKFWMGF